jgi:large subunit ribosomal protein L22
MEAKAILKHLRISSQKTRLVADLVRGKSVEKAIDILKFNNRSAAKPIRKLVESAMANAENNHGLDVDVLWIKEIKVDPGKTLKRFRPRAQGRAFQIRKRTCHISLILAEK